MSSAKAEPPDGSPHPAIGNNPPKLGLRVRFLARALPRAFGCERKDGVLALRLLRGLSLRVPTELADEMNSVSIYLVSPFLPL